MTAEATGEAALLAAVVSDPDDDAPRLRYADCLAARGDPRAELIRAQCKGDPDRAASAQPERRLAERLPAAELRASGHVWRRGFLHGVTVACHTVSVERLAALWAAEPLVRELTIDFAGAEIDTGGVGPVISSPLCDQLTALRLPDAFYTWSPDYHHSPDEMGPYIVEVPVGARLLPGLCARPFPHLVELALPNGGVDDPSPLCGWPALARLERLDLGRNPLGPEAGPALAAILDRARLRALALGECKLAGGVAALAGSRALAALEALDLRWNHVPASAASALAESPFAGDRLTIDLRCNWLGDAAAATALRRRFGERVLLEPLDLASVAP